MILYDEKRPGVSYLSQGARQGTFDLVYMGFLHHSATINRL
jgi:hypothetical protein